MTQKWQKRRMLKESISCDRSIVESTWVQEQGEAEQSNKSEGRGKNSV